MHVTFHASVAGASPQMSIAAGRQQLTVYVREGCPHCAEAKRYTPILQCARKLFQSVGLTGPVHRGLHRRRQPHGGHSGVRPGPRQAQ